MATTTSEEFKKATDYQFKEEDIERAKALGMENRKASRESACLHGPMNPFGAVVGSREQNRQGSRGRAKSETSASPSAPFAAGCGQSHVLRLFG